MSTTSSLLASLTVEEKRELLAKLLQQKGNVERSFPVSFAQQRLWFLEQLLPGTPLFNIPSGFRIPGLRQAALERAVQEVVRRHEVLRTTFSVVNEHPVQVIAPSLEIPMPVVDLRGLPAAEREQRAQQLAAEEAVRPFDLSCGPLLRTTLLRVSDADYIFLITLHHIVSDGWSTSVFFRELGVLYEAYALGRPSPLPELPIQYADYAVWQREHLRGEVLQEHLNYWKRQLEGAPAVLQLPSDRPRPAVPSFRGGVQQLYVPRYVTEKLNALSQRKGTTLFMTLLAAFQTLLYRYTSQEDIVVGSPIANRLRAELEGLIGFFVNTLVLRTDLSGEPSFRELLGRVREMTLGAYAHQDLPFEKLVEELQPERDLNRNPLFQVMFVLQNTPGAEAAGAQQPPTGSDPGIIPVGTGTAKFDLTLSVMETAHGLMGGLEYSADLFDAATAERMARHLENLLAGIAADPDRKLWELPLLTAAEQEQFREWNATEVPFPDNICLHELVEAQVERTPEAVAVVFEAQELTYGELNRRANRLAHYLRQLGVGPEVLVGICMQRSLEMVVAVLGVLKAGGAYVPLDPDYPAERLSFMLADTQAPVLLTQKWLRAMLPASEATVICVEELPNEPGSEENLPRTVRPGHPAYVIYTSGSTGRPKGAVIPHRAICNHMQWIRLLWEPSADDVVLQRTPFSFDASVWEFYYPLMAGATLVVVPPEAHRDFDLLARTIAKSRATVLQCVPSVLHGLLLNNTFDLLKSLRRVYCGGEALLSEVQHHFMSRSTASLTNLYGPTEAAIDVTFHTCSPTPYGSAVPIGRPISNVRTYIVDEHLQPLPVGVQGELCIGGAALARGYLNHAALTAEKFIPDPFGSTPGARLYRTGDMARYLPDGNIEFLGRSDRQVKLRGFRIELGEVQAALRQHGDVRDAAVIMREDQSGDVRLVAYVVPAESGATDVEQLRTFLKEKLPEYMVPSAFVPLQAIPLTPNGKVDYLALPASERTAPTRYRVPPATAVEELLAEIWAQVLQIDEVGINENFFDLGGHSLKATLVVSRVREALQVELPLRFIFEFPTISEQAVHLGATEADKDRLERIAIFVLRVADIPDHEISGLLEKEERVRKEFDNRIETQ